MLQIIIIIYMVSGDNIPKQSLAHFANDIVCKRESNNAFHFALGIQKKVDCARLWRFCLLLYSRIVQFNIYNEWQMLRKEWKRKKKDNQGDRQRSIGVGEKTHKT